MAKLLAQLSVLPAQALPVFSIHLPTYPTRGRSNISLLVAARGSGLRLILFFDGMILAQVGSEFTKN